MGGKMNSKSISRWRITLRHEHKNNPIKYWGTLHIGADFNMQRFRKQLSKLSNIPLMGIIEQASKTTVPHFHFLFHTNPNKQTFRAILVRCLEGQDIRLQIERIKTPEAIFKYVTKKDCYKGRNAFTNGKFFSKKTETLRKLTSKEVRQWAEHLLSTDEKLAQMVVGQVINREQLKDACFLSWWQKAGGRFSEEVALALDNAGYNTWGNHYDNVAWAQSIT